MADKFRAVVFPIVLVMGAITFLATGVYVGYELASMRGETSAWSCLTYSAENYVQTLKRIRSGNVNDATAGLETYVNFNVVLMGGSGRKDVEESLVRIRNYRTQHPWSGSEPWINAKVAKILAEGK